MKVEHAVLRLYRALSRALPGEFRARHGGELDDTARTLLNDAARGGPFGMLVLLPRLLADVLLRAAIEHLSDLVRDTKYACRVLAASPGFTFAAVACLAIGTGLTAAMYAQVQSTMLRDLPVVCEPSTLVRLQNQIAFAYVDAFRESGEVFGDMAASMGPVPLVVKDREGRAHRVWGQIVTPEYFEVLGIEAALGRLFGVDEKVPEAGQSAVFSHRLWQSRYGGDPSVVGRPVRVNGQLATVTGVAPPGFLGASPMTSAADVWVPVTARVSLAPELAQVRDPNAAVFDVIGRLAPGVTPAHAEDALESLTRELERVHNDPRKDRHERRIRLLPGGRMFPVRDEDLPRAIGFPLVLVSLVLLMACANVANLILARSATRRAEIAIRVSLGAGRGRIVRQLLTESLILVGLGGIVGALFAHWLLSLFESMRPVIPGFVEYSVHFHWQAFAGAMLVASAAIVLFGLAPAIRASRQDVYAGLKPAPASRLRGSRWFGMRNLLVFQQVTVSIVLVLLTAFVVVGWRRAAGVDVGYEVSNLYFVGIDPVRDGYAPERARSFFDRLPRQLERVPGIERVSLAQTLPLAMAGSEVLLGAKSDFVGGTTMLGAIRTERVGAGFFETVGAPILRGRGFTDGDETDEARVVVVNQTMARQVWPGEDPIGQTVDLAGERWQVIGVLRDIRSAFPLVPTLPAVYRPVSESGFDLPSRHGVTVALRVAPGFDAATRLRREIEALDPDVTVFYVKRMADEIDQALYLARAATFMYGGMGLFGLILASVGLAGVTAYGVAHRTHEIGIRMALGARPARVLWLVLREGGAIAAAGTLAGLVLALAATRALASVLDMLAETTRTSVSDPLLLLGAPALLLGLSIAACYLPARRAIRIDPVRALRAE